MQSNSPLERLNVLLTLGLTEKDQNTLNTQITKTYTVQSLDNSSTDEILYALNQDNSHALMLWLGDKAWEIISQNEKIMEGISFLPCVLLISEDCPAERYNAISKEHFQKILYSPLLKEDIEKLLLSVLSHTAKMYDVQAMNREILLMRELYTQKKDLLTFICDSIKHIDSASSLEDLFENVRFSFESVLPLQSMHLALWNKDGSKINYYLGLTHKEAIKENIWVEKMNNALEEISPCWLPKQAKQVENFEKINRITEQAFSPQVQFMGNYNYTKLNPELGSLLVIPLTINDSHVGFLLLQVLCSYNATKDMSTALDVVRSHMSFAFAQKYASSLITFVPFLQEPLYPIQTSQTQQ